jgi:hypothetical protein
MARQTPAWERVYGRVRARAWETIALSWLEYIPIGPVIFDDVPPSNAEDETDLATWLCGYPREEAQYRTVDSFPGFRAGLFRESCFLLMKSICVLEEVARQIEDGRPSWSQSNSYHAAFFCCRAVLGFLGVTFASAGGHTYVIDLWGQDPQRTKKRRMPPQFGTLAIMCGSPNTGGACSNECCESRKVSVAVKRLLRLTKVILHINETAYITTPTIGRSEIFRII